ncbi:MAG: AI-2E family transporter [Phycisphaerales bacterium]|nr:AI-2E family transporter [Phycisphaerales bacterium]
MSDQKPESQEDSLKEGVHSLHLWQIQAVRDMLLIVTIVVVFWVGYAMRAITIPLLIALGLAYLFEPLIAWLGRRWGWKRRWAVSTILLAFIVGVIVVLVPTTMLVVGQTADFVGNIRSGKYANLVDKSITLLPKDYQAQARNAREWLERSVPWTQEIFGDEDPSESGSADTGAGAPAKPAEAGETVVATQEADDNRVRMLVREELARLKDDPKAAEQGSNLGVQALGFVGKGVRQVGSFILGTVELGLLVFLVPFYFFFFSNAYPKVLEFGNQLIPEHNRPRLVFLFGEMNRAVSGFVRGRLVISAILGVVLAVGWLIVGVPYSVALGLVVGVFCAVPYLSIIGLPIAIGLLAVEEFSVPEAERMAWWGVVVWPLLVYFIAQTLDDWVLTPLIQGKATDLDPVSVVVAILAGGSLAGIYGMLLAVPAAACIKIILREVVMPRVKEWTSGRARDPLPGGD